MYKLSGILLVVLISGCASPGETSGGLASGQWTPVRDVGVNKFLIEGYNTEDAIAGGTVYCSKMSKKFDALTIVPSDSRRRSTITFTCL